MAYKRRGMLRFLRLRNFALIDQLELHFDAGDLEAEIIIRREISPDDRNRVFINNQPTTVSSLRELAPLLLDIHGQHEQQTLLDHARQLDLIDAYADSAGLAGKVREIFTT